MTFIWKYKDTFDQLIQAVQINDTLEPMSNSKTDNELGLCNPYSRITCFILYLYSLEFGTPPLYAELNRISRDQDYTQLETLGPFARALSKITLSAESYRKNDDRIMTGGQIQKMTSDAVGGNIAGIFLLWRGPIMKSEWVLPYEQNTFNHVFKKGDNKGKPLYVHLPGNQSCSQNLKVALRFAIGNRKEDYISTLFVISCQNYCSPDGFRMNNEAYTAYPSEREILLRDGCPVFVLALEKDIVINNQHTAFNTYNG